MAKGKGGFINHDGLNAPDQPTNVSGTAGDSSASVSFTAPSNEGGAAVTGYRVTDSTGVFGASGSSSPIIVSGLTNGSSYTFKVWAINPFGWSSPSAASESITPAATTALFGGGISTAVVNTIDTVEISTTGNATDFGDLTSTRQLLASCSSSTRGVWAGGFISSAVNTIDYVTIASSGNASDFGDLINTGAAPLYGAGGSSNETRGLFFGGNNGTATVNVIQYITIATTGNATDFGDMSLVGFLVCSCASSTRSIYAGFSNTSNVMEYVTIASTGNGTDFGDLTQNRNNQAALSSPTVGVFGGGSTTSDVQVNTIDYVTIASAGNATDFGDLTTAKTGVRGTSSVIRGVFAGGGNSNPGTNVIEYIAIASAGNATDFGDLTQSRRNSSALSSGHGGLS